MKSVLAQIEPTTRGAAPATSLRWALVSLSLSMLMPSLDASIASTALPALARAFGASFGQVQWIVLAYLLAITTLIVSVGRLGDMIGRKRLLLTGIVLFTAASLLCGSAPSLWLLIAARAIQGLGAAVMLALTIAMARDTVPKEKTGSAMGLLGTMAAIGTSLGPSVGGILTAALGWPAIFLVNLPLGIANLILAYRYLPADADEKKTVSFDMIGTILLALTLAAYALAMTMARGSFGALNMILLFVAICGAALFILAEARAASPLIRLTMFRKPGLSAGLAMSVLVATVIATTFVVGPFDLSRALGLSTAFVGVTMSTGPLIAALTGFPAGRIVDRLGTARTTIVGLFALAIGCVALSVLPTTLGVIGYIAPIAILTIGYAFFQAANNTAIMTDVQPDQRGVISGMLSLSRNLGLVTGASAMAAVFALASMASDVTTADSASVAKGTGITFGVAACLIAVALAISTTTRRKTGQA